MAQQPGRDAPTWQAGDEQCRAVDWVKRPQKFTVEPLASLLFAQDAVIGVACGDALDQRTFDLHIRLGNPALVGFAMPDDVAK